MPLCFETGENVDSTGALGAEQLVARGPVTAGAAIVPISINPDLRRHDANYLKIQRL